MNENTPSSPQPELNATVDLLCISNGNEVSSTSKIPTSILEQLKETLTCPITLDLIEDPVIASDGFTYERSAIQRWMAENAVSPITKKALKFAELRDNLIIKSLLITYHEQMNQKPAAMSTELACIETRNCPHCFFKSTCLHDRHDNGNRA